MRVALWVRGEPRVTDAACGTNGHHGVVLFKLLNEQLQRPNIDPLVRAGIIFRGWKDNPLFTVPVVMEYRRCSHLIMVLQRCNDFAAHDPWQSFRHLRCALFAKLLFALCTAFTVFIPNVPMLHNGANFFGPFVLVFSLFSEAIGDE